MKCSTCSLSLDHDCLDPKLSQDVSACSTCVGFLDSAGKRTFSTDRKTACRGDTCSAQQPWREDQFIVRPQGITGWRDFFEEQFDDQCPATQMLINGRDILPLHLELIHIDAE